MKTGTLYLIPTPLDERADADNLAAVLPAAVGQHVHRLAHYIVEHPKTARQFLKLVGTALPLQEIDMQVLDEHTRPEALLALLAPLLAGNDVGLLSEAGCPAVADPGANLVRLAHQKNIRVVPLVGPSSILLALMASGLNGQRFAFHGYLPVEAAPRHQKILQLEKESATHQQTQIFIETPYRNQKLLATLLETCKPDTLLCIACNLTLSNEYIATRSIKAWQRALPDIHKKPAIFLLGTD